jgi:hypothetical protein
MPEAKRKPIMAWESQEPFDSNARVVWWSRVDDRYQVEVQRVDKSNGQLCIFDHVNNDVLIFEEPVALSYGAAFGPDVDDVDEWREIVLNAIDART